MWIAAAFLACSEEEIVDRLDNTQEPLDLPMSLYASFEMEGHHLDNAENLDDNEVICTFQMMDGDASGQEYKIHGRIVKQRRTTRLVLDRPLHTGKQFFLYISYRAPKDPVHVLRTFGLNLELDVKDDGVDVELPDNHYMETGIQGEGTEENPYLISNPNDLIIMQDIINDDGGGDKYKGAHFRQISDIDMTVACNYLNVEYGWIPIGHTNTCPFQGYYHGEGHTLSNLRIARANTYSVGLFGCLYGALVEDLVIKDAQVEAMAAAGAVAGAVVVGGGDNHPGNNWVSSHISNCRVENSKVKSSMYAGMLVGMADAYSRLLVDSCTVSDNNTLETEYGGGGIVGVGVFQSSVALEQVANYGVTIRTLIGAAGGLIGTSDSLMVINSFNKGNVEVADDNEERFAAGGIAGATGNGVFLNCINEGAVKGDRGVGGILGSALLEKGDGTEDKPGVYNTAHFTTCLNKGKVEARNYGGGICGEAQVVAISCGNFGDVNLSGTHAGGIVGNSPAIALVDCMNKGNICAERVAGGLNGMDIFGTTTFCNNYGRVKAYNGNSGGMMALGGGGAMIHYCGNYGEIIAGGDGYAGGIVGELGKVREWSDADYAAVVMGSIAIVTSVANIVVSSVFTSKASKLKKGKTADAKNKLKPLEKKIKGIEWAFRGLSITQGVVNLVLMGFDIDARLHNGGVDADAVGKARSDSYQQRSDFLADSLSQVRKAMTDMDCALVNDVAGKKMLEDQIDAFESEREAVMKDSVKRNSLNEEIDARRAILQEGAVEEKKLRDTGLDIANAVIAVVSMALFATTLALIPGAGVPLALGIVSSALVIVSGANGIAKSVMNYQVNATEITQCYNYGKVSGGKSNGGIVGLSNDYGRLYDSYNAGAINAGSSYAGYIAGQVGNQTVIVNTYNMSASGGASGMVGKKAENPLRINHNHDVRNASGEKSYYSGFDFEDSWKTPETYQEDGANKYRLPVINLSEYANSTYNE